VLRCAILNKMRLDKFLSNMGIISRKELKAYVKKGQVTVNGHVAQSSDMQIDEENDKVVFCGEEIAYSRYVYVMLNKPSGYLSATEDGKGKTVIDLLDDRRKKMELFPVGRLDKDTEGLLILTNDGELCHKLLSPKYHVDKKYYVESELPLKESNIEDFENGVFIDGGYKTLPAKLEITDDAGKSYVTIHEGKFHQIKQMFRAVGNGVVYLERVEFGGLCLDSNLERGEWRFLTDEETELLKSKTNRE